MNRVQAFLWHLLGSGLVLLAVFSCVKWIWYPGRLLDAASGTNLMLLIIGVDLIVGPLITLIIFNPKKTSLKFDMACVLICQIAFMLYGVWSVHAARPAYLAFVDNRFYLVTANEVDPADQRKAKNPAFRELPLFGPQVVATAVPDDAALRESLALAGTRGMGVQNLPQYFVPYAERAPAAIAAGKGAKELIESASEFPKEDLPRLLEFESRKRAEGKKVLFLRFLNKKTFLYMAIDGSTGAVLEIV